MLSFRSAKRRAFTLIELLTVIAIIGILATMIVGVVAVVKKQARVAASKKMYQEWSGALEQYKSAYGMYPFIGDRRTNGDRFIDLRNTRDAAEFIKCLSGKNPLFDGAPGAPLSPEDARKFNRMGKEFCSFGADALQKTDAGTYTNLLADKFDNTRIRIYMDADNNGIINPVPTDLAAMRDIGVVNNSIAAKVIIYTLKSDGGEYEDILSWQ